MSEPMMVALSDDVIQKQPIAYLVFMDDEVMAPLTLDIAERILEAMKG